MVCVHRQKAHEMATGSRLRGLLTLNLILSGIQSLLWFGVMLVLTFGQPYVYVGNGFFATWAGFLMSLSIFVDVLHECTRPNVAQNERETQRINRAVASGCKGCLGLVSDQFRALGLKFSVLCLASSVLFGSGVAACQDGCEVSEAFALSAGLVSLFFVGFYFHLHIVDLKKEEKRLTRNVQIISFSLLLLLWIGVGIVTFEGPFSVAGNGYFAAWIGIFASAFLVSLVNF